MIATSALILAGLGGKDATDRAVIAYVRNVAKGLNASILLYQSIYTPAYEKDIYELSERQRKKESSDVVRVRERLNRFAQALSDDGFEVTVSLNWRKRDDEAFKQITGRVRPALIICARSQITWLNRVELSDTDWQLSKLTDTPVVYVDRPFPESTPRTVWAAVDPMHTRDDHRRLNDLIIGKAKILAEAIGAELHLVHCYSSAKKLAEIAIGLASAEHLPAKDVQHDIRETHHGKLMALAEHHNLDPEHVHNLPGLAQIVLPLLAAKRRPAIIVAGAQNRGAVSDLVLGSTARKLLHRVYAGLCIVRLPLEISESQSDATHTERTLAGQGGTN